MCPPGVNAGRVDFDRLVSIVKLNQAELSLTMMNVLIDSISIEMIDKDKLKELIDDGYRIDNVRDFIQAKIHQNYTKDAEDVKSLIDDTKLG